MSRANCSSTRSIRCSPRRTAQTHSTAAIRAGADARPGAGPAAATTIARDIAIADLSPPAPPAPLPTPDEPRFPAPELPTPAEPRFRRLTATVAADVAADARVLARHRRPIPVRDCPRQRRRADPPNLLALPGHRRRATSVRGLSTRRCRRPSDSRHQHHRLRQAPPAPAPPTPPTPPACPPTTHQLHRLHPFHRLHPTPPTPPTPTNTAHSTDAADTTSSANEVVGVVDVDVAAAPAGVAA